MHMKTHICVCVCTCTCTYLHICPYFNCGSPLVLWAAHLRYSFLLGNVHNHTENVE